MYRYVNEHFEHKYDAIIRVLADRWAAYLALDYERRNWRKRAIEAEAKVQELMRARRELRAASRGESS